jgi:serine/threonine-protein kinase
MHLTPTHIVELSRLLDAALTLEPEQRGAWLAALSGDQREFLPALQEMLAQHGRMDEHPLLATLPRLKAPDAEIASAGDLVGPYRLLRPLGRGGMSVVWLAERADEGVKRQVAIKLPLLTLSTPRQLERFTRERDVLAGLEHAHIARLYEAGVSPAGQPYLVLEYVDGVPLTQHCDERRMGLAARLHLFLQVLAAVEHAHKHLVVHRDLKPSNILVDRQGQVKLLDFGIAKLLPDPDQPGCRADTTQQGGWVLTPLYAAPEQLQGHAVTTATDIYALGVVLYEQLTGEWPYGARQGAPPPHRPAPRSLPELMHAVLNADAIRPSAADLQEPAAQRREDAGVQKLRARLRGDLDTIVLKALRKPPGQRYSSAERFADDVRRFLAHQPIAARAPSRLHGLHLFMRRHRGASLSAGAGAVVALAIGVVAWQQHRQSVEHQERAVTIRDFMFDMVGDAEPDELHPAGPVTAQQMLDGAVRRARAGYGDMPRLQGELLGELGYMYHRLGETATAEKLQSEALALLAAHAPETEPALNKVRARLADALIEHQEEDQREHALALARTAIDRCRGSDGECAKVRAYGLGAIASSYSLRGRFDAALAVRRRIVHEAAQGFGRAHNETVQAMNDVAVEARNAGRLREADQALQELLATARTRTLRSVIRVNILLMSAVLDIDLGRYEPARRQLLALIGEAPGTHGPQLHDRWQARPGHQLVGMHRLLARVLFLQGDPMAARQAAEAAIEMLRQKPPEIAHLYARLMRARVMSVMEKPQGVLDEVASVIKALHDMGQAADAGPVLVARQLRGELLARAGRLVQARQELEAVVAVHAGSAQPDRVQQAQALDQLGAVLRGLGFSGQALARHEQARPLLQSTLPEEHPLLARNALYREAARMEPHGGAGRQQAFLRQADLYKRLFPGESIWRRMVERHLGSVRAGPGAPGGSLLLL